MTTSKNLTENIVAGASEIFCIHRLDAIEWVKKHTKNGGEMYARNFTLRDKFNNVLDFVARLREDGHDVHNIQYDGAVTKVEFNILCYGAPLLAIISRSNPDIWVHAYSVSKNSVKKFESHYAKNSKRLKIDWWYPNENGAFNEHEIDFHHDIEVHDEHFPFVPGGVRNYLNEYMQSSAPILLLIGEPGTGKTSFIRHLIHEHQLEAMVSYDDRVMSSDRFYCNFLTSEKKNLMVIEDADLLLQRRKDGKNPTMTKLLNISNGVIQIGAKKMVFSTNLDSLNDVDEALIRPGRCFDILDFRRLTPEEAEIASSVSGLPPLETPHKRDYTLAEIFNRKKMTYRTHRMGF